MSQIAHRYRRSRRGLPLGILLALISPTGGRADPADDARAKAEACSGAVIARDALPARETPSDLAQRAYDSCIVDWADAAHLLADRMVADPAVAALRRSERTLNGSTPAGTYLGLRSASSTLRSAFMREALSKIRATRYGASSDDGATP